ncbi:protein delta homolog 2 [Anolis carolinensis]|uniref:protein delta homolog 2 n=1 Tax=Anolis carolinensis TaxID=28377 RepID=UPI0002C88B78|nr:PREDICTED: protein delta homolog 2 isoform X2 [Anolis carolinensis]|eukprot:XP_008123535.1 PREDICTED: protein delta homolog 2 isoform X2 [Anolis carolinensis]
MLRSFYLQLMSLLWILVAHHHFTQGDDCSDHCNLAHGSCEDGKCRCDPGWDGASCEQCVRMLGCIHGTCHQPWQCICQSGWAGKFCDKDVHICEHQPPCQNGAECIYDRDGEYSCLCLEEFHGKDCELKTGPCEKSGFPCKNGGLCQDKNGFASNYTCKCLAGFTGAHCEIDVDDCLMQPCANGATCLDGMNRFSCQCQAGFEGRFCTINIDDCANQPCRNGAKCYDRINDFDCLCPEGFVGKTCELPAPEPTWVTAFEPGHKDNDNAVTSIDPWTAQSDPARTAVTGKRITNYSEKSNGGGLLISVKEVVTQQDSGLSQSQLILLLVFGLLTMLLVFVTVLMVLLKNWQRGNQRCQSPSQSARKLQDQECQVGMLSTVLIEPRKTTEL